MINREMKNVTVISFVDTTDSYGQKRQTVSGTRTVEMVCKIYVQRETDTPLFNNVEMIGITKDKDIKDTNQIEIDTVKYNVLHIIPSNRYYQILMQKVK